MDLQHLRASDGTGEAVLAHVQATRTIGSTVLDLDNVDNWNADAIVVTGTPAANGFISPTGMTIMYGHLNAGDFIIDGYAPGYSDAGNTTAEVAIIKMTTNWADALVDILKISHNDDGTIKNNAITTEAQFTDNVDPVMRAGETMFDHVDSGCVLTGTGYGSTLAWSLTAGVVFIGGKRLTVAAATGVVVATKDTYFDLLDPGTGTVATLVYTGGNSVAVNAASPALAASSVRIAIIQSGANIASVAAINQGQETKVLPIASSIPYQVTDSLGNLICPRDPQKRLLGFRRIVSTFTAASAALQDITGLSTTVTSPGLRKLEIVVHLSQLYNSIDDKRVDISIEEDGVVIATAYNRTWSNPAGGNGGFKVLAVSTPSAGAHTYKARCVTSSGTPVVFAAATTPSFIEAKLAQDYRLLCLIYVYY